MYLNIGILSDRKVYPNICPFADSAFTVHDSLLKYNNPRRHILCRRGFAVIVNSGPQKADGVKLV